MNLRGGSLDKNVLPPTNMIFFTFSSRHWPGLPLQARLSLFPNSSALNHPSLPSSSFRSLMPPPLLFHFQAVVITEVSRETLNFFAQFVDDGPKLEKLMEEVNQELTANPPLPGAYTPKRGELCAAKFEDGFWYR